jgi:hypothetical protein
MVIWNMFSYSPFKLLKENIGMGAKVKMDESGNILIKRLRDHHTARLSHIAINLSYNIAKL